MSELATTDATSTLASQLSPRALGVTVHRVWKRAALACERAVPRALLPYVGGLLAIEAALVAAHLYWPGVRLVDLDKEFNIPSWFSSFQLGALAIACFLVGEAQRHRGRGFARAVSRLGWAACGLGFLYLSLDEACVIHEGVLRSAVETALPPASPLQEIVPWQLVFAPAIVGAFVVLCFLFHLYLERPRLGLALGGLALLGASFALEGLAKGLFIPLGAYRLEVVLEEAAELLGTTCLLAAITAEAYTLLASGHASRPRVPVRLAWNRAIVSAGALLGLPAAVVGGVLLWRH